MCTRFCVSAARVRSASSFRGPRPRRLGGKVDRQVGRQLGRARRPLERQLPQRLVDQLAVHQPLGPPHRLRRQQQRRPLLLVQLHRRQLVRLAVDGVGVLVRIRLFQRHPQLAQLLLVPLELPLPRRRIARPVGRDRLEDLRPGQRPRPRPAATAAAPGSAGRAPAPSRCPPLAASSRASRYPTSAPPLPRLSDRRVPDSLQLHVLPQHRQVQLERLERLSPDLRVVAEQAQRQPLPGLFG